MTDRPPGDPEDDAAPLSAKKRGPVEQVENSNNTNSPILASRRRRAWYAQRQGIACLDRVCVNCWCGRSLVELLQAS